MTNYFINWTQHQYDYYNYQDDEDFHIQAEKLFEEIEIIDNVKDEDALGRNCEESLENYVYFDIGQMFGVILKLLKKNLMTKLMLGI